jgi:hypothetical protein
MRVFFVFSQNLRHNPSSAFGEQATVLWTTARLSPHRNSQE